MKLLCEGSAWWYHAPVFRSLRRAMIVYVRMMLFDTFSFCTYPFCRHRVCSVNARQAYCPRAGTSAASPRTSEASPRYLQTFMESMRSLSSQSSYLHCVPPRCTVQAVHAAPHTSHIHPTEYDHRFHAWLNLDLSDQYLHILPHTRQTSSCGTLSVAMDTPRHVPIPPGCMVVYSDQLKTQSPCHSTSNSITIRLPLAFRLTSSPLPLYPENLHRIQTLQVPRSIHGHVPSMYHTPLDFNALQRLHTVSSHFRDHCCTTYTHMDQTQTVKCFRVIQQTMPGLPTLDSYPPYTDEELDQYSIQPL